MGGSSPRIRGELAGSMSSLVTGGIIPANTGRMVPPTLKCPPIRDHPREYGENNPLRSMMMNRFGSSPRIRGESTDYLEGTGGERIIPANTGRIQPSSTTARNPPDHPREYGENEKTRTETQKLRGSSPRIRGEFLPLREAPPRGGIIPANTGRITTRRATCSSWRDHPREYGENSKMRPPKATVEGSSPRIRGELWG